MVLIQNVYGSGIVFKIVIIQKASYTSIIKFFFFMPLFVMMVVEKKINA
jgi:hypothetical protein